MNPGFEKKFSGLKRDNGEAKAGQKREELILRRESLSFSFFFFVGWRLKIEIPSIWVNQMHFISFRSILLFLYISMENNSVICGLQDINS